MTDFVILTVLFVSAADFCHFRGVFGSCATNFAHYCGVFCLHAADFGHFVARNGRFLSLWGKMANFCPDAHVQREACVEREVRVEHEAHVEDEVCVEREAPVRFG